VHFDLEHVLSLVSMGFLPWSIALIYLIVGVIRSQMSKAKPELILVALSFVVIVGVGVLSRSTSRTSTSTKADTKDITQMGSQNIAGVAGSIAQTMPCQNSNEGNK
jgi:membrane protein implicated in regulation of membrane protease activity